MEYVGSNWFSDETLQREAGKGTCHQFCAHFVPRAEWAGRLAFVLSFNPRLENTRTQNKCRRRSPGLALNKAVSDHSCFGWPGLPLHEVLPFLLGRVLSLPTPGTAPFPQLFSKSGLSSPPVACVSAALVDTGSLFPQRLTCLSSPSLGDSRVLVLTGSPGPPASGISTRYF